MGNAVFMPEISVDLYESYQKGDLAEAQKYHQVISKLMDVYNYGPTFFTAMKEPFISAGLTCRLDTVLHVMYTLLI